MAGQVWQQLASGGTQRSSGTKVGRWTQRKRQAAQRPAQGLAERAQLVGAMGACTGAGVLVQFDVVDVVERVTAARGELQGP